MSIKELKQRYLFIYEIIMLFVIFMAIISLSSEFTMDLSSKELIFVTVINYLIWGIFIIDYIGRLYISDDRLKFIKSNIFDLISIFPFPHLFKVARGIHLIKNIKLLRLSISIILLVFFRKMKRNINYLVQKSSIFYIIWLTVITIFLGAIGLYLTEERPFMDSLWWSFVTATTVGYGDISPSTTAGRLIACVLMITGIGLIGMLTGNITSFFINKKHTTSYKSEAIENIKDKLDDFDNLSSEDIEYIYKTLKALKK
jgi:voltage-gated potassium channel